MDSVLSLIISHPKQQLITFHPLSSLPMASYNYAPVPSSDSQLPHFNKQYEGAGYSKSNEGRFHRFALPCLQTRRVLRWALVTIICFGLVVAGHVAYTLAFPPPEEGEFDACARLLTPNPTQYRVTPGNNEDQSDWAKTMRPSELMDLVDLGLPPPKRLIHQSWKTRDNLPDHFQKWSNDWRRVHGTNWT